MDRATLVEKFEQAKIRVADCAQQADQQEKLIAVSRADGRSIKDAEELLRGLKLSHALYLAHRNRLKHLLAAADPE